MTRLIARSRHGHRERLMGTLSVVDDSPLIKEELPLSQASTVLIAQDLGFKSAMKAFVFTLSLGMMWRRKTWIRAVWVMFLVLLAQACRATAKREWSSRMVSG